MIANHKKDPLLYVNDPRLNLKNRECTEIDFSFLNAIFIQVNIVGQAFLYVLLFLFIVFVFYVCILMYFGVFRLISGWG